MLFSRYVGTLTIDLAMSEAHANSLKMQDTKWSEVFAEDNERMLRMAEKTSVNMGGKD